MGSVVASPKHINIHTSGTHDHVLHVAQRKPLCESSNVRLLQQPGAMIVHMKIAIDNHLPPRPHPSMTNKQCRQNGNVNVSGPDSPNTTKRSQGHKRTVKSSSPTCLWCSAPKRHSTRCCSFQIHTHTHTHERQSTLPYCNLHRVTLPSATQLTSEGFPSL